MEIFPFLLSGGDFTSFQGFVNYGKREFPLQLEIKNGHIFLKSNSEMMKIIFSYEEMIQQRISQCQNYESIITELNNILEKICPKDEIELATTNFYNKIISEIDQIGWDKVIDMNSNLSKITFQTM
jgi:hypothetical protein